MRVAIDCRSFLKKQYTGIGRYAYHLVKSLGDIDRDNEYHLYARKGLFCFKRKLPLFPSKNLLARVDRFNRGPAKFLKDIDIVHYPSPSPLEVPGNAKIVVTVHDLIFKSYPSGHTRETVQTGENQFRDIRQRAAKIICCSESTKNDLKKYYDIPDSRIATVHQGVDKAMFYRTPPSGESAVGRVLQKYGLKPPYILSVGTI